MTDGFKHEAVGVQPESREVVRPILRELLWLVEDLIAQFRDPAVNSMYGRARRHEKREMLQPGTMPGIGPALERRVEEDWGSPLACGPVGEMILARREDLEPDQRHDLAGGPDGRQRRTA